MDLDTDYPALETNMSVEETWETLKIIDEVYQNVHDIDTLEKLCADPNLPDNATDTQKALAQRIFGAEAARAVGHAGDGCYEWRESQSTPGQLDQEDTFMLLVAMGELTQNIESLQDYRELRQPNVLKEKLNALYLDGGKHTEAQLELADQILEHLDRDYQQMEKTGSVRAKRYFGMFTAYFPSWRGYLEGTDSSAGVLSNLKLD
jgi:hypothetical protein